MIPHFLQTPSSLPFAVAVISETLFERTPI
jgi:hypothetical protein